MTTRAPKQKNNFMQKVLLFHKAGLFFLCTMREKQLTDFSCVLQYKYTNAKLEGGIHDEVFEQDRKVRTVPNA
jgi:hypothetical protein